MSSATGCTPVRPNRRLATATKPKAITLHKPTAISGADPTWFDRFYDPAKQAFRDRVLFST